MKMTKMKFLIIYLAILVLPLSFVAIGSYLLPSLNMIAFKTYYTYYGGMCLGFASLVILFLTNLLIKHNIDSNENSKLDKKYLLKANLIFIIFHLLISIISNLLTYFNVISYFIYALYFFYPLIYFCLIIFLDHRQLTYKNILCIVGSIYFCWYFLVPLITFIINNINSFNSISIIKSLLYNLFYYFMQFALLVLPFASLGLIKITNEKKEKSLVRNFQYSIKKLFIIAFIVLLLNIIIVLLLNSF